MRIGVFCFVAIANFDGRNKEMKLRGKYNTMFIVCCSWSRQSHDRNFTDTVALAANRLT